MAVDIESFKRDLEQLKNQRSIVQAKLDEANRHIEEITRTLKGMGFNSIDEAKQAYLRQMSEAETQHNLVKQLIAEISQVDANVPTREEVAQRLNSLSMNDFAGANSVPDSVISNIVQSDEPVDVIEDLSVEAEPLNVSEGTVDLNDSTLMSINNSNVDLGNLLFSSL